jgi:hypothetical protein
MPIDPFIHWDADEQATYCKEDHCDSYIAIHILLEKYDDKRTATIPPSSVAPMMIG